MENYAVVEYSDGATLVSSEHGENLQGAYTAYHTLCAALWNETAAVNAYVRVVDKKLETVDGHAEQIVHDAKA